MSAQLDIYVYSASLSCGRYGDVYLMGGFNRGVPTQGTFGWSVTAGWMITNSSVAATQVQLLDVMLGESKGAGFYDLLGASVSGNKSGMIINIGLGQGRGSLSPYTYTWKIH